MARHPKMLDRNKAALIVIDMQARFTPIIPDYDEIEKNVLTLINGSKVLGLPIFYTEQYPKGLGRTTEALKAELAEKRPIEKMRFSIAEEKVLMTALKDAAITHLILVGIETHVCMLQSALDLQHMGYIVHIIQDATGSRNPLHRDVAVARMRQEGVTISVTESALFELAEISGTDEFKQLSKMVK